MNSGMHFIKETNKLFQRSEMWKHPQRYNRHTRLRIVVCSYIQHKKEKNEYTTNSFLKF